MDRDEETGGSYSGDRYTESGRWKSEDRSGFIGGDTNLKRLVANSPLMFLDPNGQAATPFTFSFSDPRNWILAGLEGGAEYGRGMIRQPFDALVGVGGLVREAGATIGDYGMGVVEVGVNLSGRNYRHEDWSRTARSLNTPGANLPSYYLDLYNNMNTFGVYSQVQASAQFCNGQMSADEYRQFMYSMVAMQLVSAKAIQYSTVRGNPSNGGATTGRVASSGRGNLPGSGVIDTGVNQSAPGTGVIDTGLNQYAPGTGVVDTGIIPRSNNGLGNPFSGKTPIEIDAMFNAKGFESRGPNPLLGKGGYVNPETGRSYHIDPHNSFGEPPHVDVNRPKGYGGSLDKKKYPL